MKTSLLLSASALIASCGVATAETATKNASSTGIYFGLHGALAQGNNKHKSQNFDNSVEHRGRSGMKGGHGGLHLGFQKSFSNNLVCGIEGGTHLGRTNAGKTTNVSGDSHKTSFTRKHGVHISTKLGYELNSWVPYFRVGYDSSKFTSKTQLKSKPQASKSKRMDGLMLGFGLETQIKSMIVGVEWVHTLYETQKFNKKTNAHRINDKNSAKIGDFKIRLSYKV
jgi:opacity protein-like surface antigen